MNNLILVMFLTLTTTFSIASATNSFLNHANVEKSFDSPDTEKSEVCIVSNRFAGIKYSSKKEKKLCKLDFYFDPDIVVCPKLNSSNPGVDIYSIKDGLDKEYVESSLCKGLRKRLKKDKDLDDKMKKVGKFKQSTSCSYTPAIIAYYHFSRLFNGIGNVPQAVLRTMDLNEHIKVARKGRSYTSKADGTPSKLIGKTWKRLLESDLNPTSPKLYTKDGQYIYGALSSNPRGESKQRGRVFNGSYTGYDARYENFKKSVIYKTLLTNPVSARNIYSLDISLDSIQYLIYLKEMGDMIVLDYILGQQDRIGNIHYYDYYYYYKSADGSLKRKKSKKADVNEMHALGAVKARRLLLKDNDCGVAKSNMAHYYDLLSPIRHLDPNTYYTLLWLNENYKSNETQDYMANDLYFTKTDIRRTGRRIKGASDILKQNCLTGKLHLDADIDALIKGTEIRNSVAHCELPSGFMPHYDKNGN